ncbi:MAG: hypothetical protein K2W95_24640 [Candidatus Obscuribacterales bacterium]|nr:hypothetical protein [Candidatus Obscuribacterales bacterium]
MNAISVIDKRSSEESSSWRYFRTGKFFVAVPYSSEFVVSEGPSHSAISSLSALKHPQHFLDLLKVMPMQNAVDGVFLVEPLRHEPTREGHHSLFSDSGNRRVYLDVGADNHVRNFFHEIGHVVLDTTCDTEAMYAIACASEPALLDLGKESTPSEDWACHFEGGLFAPDTAAFEQFCHACPLRAMIMARCLMAGWTPTISFGWVAELRLRLEFVEDSIATIARLMLITAVYAASAAADRMNALTLLLRYGQDDQLAMLVPAVSGLDLSGTLLTADEIARVKVWSLLTSLDLSGTAVGDLSVCELHALSNLRNLSLRQTDVTDVALSCLHLIPLLELDLRDTAIGAGAVEHLANILTLKRLRLSASTLSEDDVQTLQKALPDCAVDIELSSS